MISLITEKSYILTVKFCQINLKKFYKRINHFDPIAYEDQAYLLYNRYVPCVHAIIALGLYQIKLILFHEICILCK